MKVRAALASKVSRERFGTELEGMLNGMSSPWHNAVCHIPFCGPLMAAAMWRQVIATCAPDPLRHDAILA